jgi:streptogrisin C
MIRSRMTAAAVAGLAAAALATSAAQAADTANDARGQQLAAGVAAYHAAFPTITEAAAQAAAAGQDDRKQLYYALQKGGPKTFGGAWFDPPSGVLHVAATDRELLDTALDLGKQLDLSVEPSLVEHSFAELDQQAAAVRARKDELGKVALSHTGIDVTTNQVQVAVTAAQREQLQPLADAAGVTLVPLRAGKVQQDAGCTSRAACDWTIRAGSMIWPGSPGNNNCSVGFTARNSSNKRFTYTAGHCSSGAGVTWGTGLQTIGAMGGSRNSGPLDASVISVDNPWFAFDHGGEIYNEFFPGRTVAVNGVAPSLSFIWSGDLVCLAANFTSPNGPNFCGVVGTNSDPSVRGMVRVDGFDACPGDSGGGWYWLTSSGHRYAYGLHSRSDTGCHGDQGGSHSWFSPLPTIKSSFTPSLNVETR